MAAARPALYREVLTPALHRRFTSSAFLVLIFSYVEGFLVAEKTSFLWTWFPLGPAGIRALLLFISALAVFILRVASLHLGVRSSSSEATSLLQSITRVSTFQTIAWYLFSAWWFSEVYIWSSPSSASLGWVTRGNAWERDRLNERPIYLRSVLLLLALSQSLVHIYYDYDSLPLTITHMKDTPISQKPQNVAAWLSERMHILKHIFSWDPSNILYSIAHNICIRVLLVCLSAPVLYGLFFRRTAWSMSLSVASLLWDLPAQRLSFIPPHYPSLIYRSVVAGFHLLFLWQSSNALFTSYVSWQPIKKGLPLSTESKDPTGTLLNGLRSKKEVPRTFAIWELALITSHFPDRRKAVFTDIDRPSGAAWTQIMSACISDITSISQRINMFLDPPPAPASVVPTPQSAGLEPLPRISTPLRQENIFSRPPAPSTSLERIESDIGSLAKSYGQSPTPGTIKLPSLSPQAKSALSVGSDKLLASPSAQKLLTAASSETVAPNGLRGLLNDYLMLFLTSRFGEPFRETFGRRAHAVVLGTPYSALYSTLCSIKSLAALAVASLDEDPFGRVSKDVPTLIRIYTESIQTIEAFVRNLPPHWTDVEFRESDRNVEDVDTVVTCMKLGLEDMLDAFVKYASELGLEPTEVAIARKAAEREDMAPANLPLTSN